MSDFDITCAMDGCGLTLSSPDRDVVMATFKAHQQEVHNFMTGQEWLSRFRDACNDLEPDTPEQYLAAAKLAAGCQSNDDTEDPGYINGRF